VAHASFTLYVNRFTTNARQCLAFRNFAVCIAASSFHHNQKKEITMNPSSTGTSAPPALRKITKKEATVLLRQRAIDRYHAAKTQRESNIQAFEAQYGRCDRIDHVLVRDLDNLMLRFSAIHARQQRTTHGEPKISKYVDQLAAMRGSLSAYMATIQALELFAPVEKREYIGWSGDEVGPKGEDQSVLAGYMVVDDTAAVAIDAEEDDADELCLHKVVEPYEDEPSCGVCVNCDQEIALRTRVDVAEEAA